VIKITVTSNSNFISANIVIADQQNVVTLQQPDTIAYNFDIFIGDNYTALKPIVGDVRIQDKDDIDDSDFIQFKVDDGLGKVQITCPNLFEFGQAVELLDTLSLKDDKEIYLDTAKTRYLKWDSLNSFFELNYGLNLTNNLYIAGNTVISNTRNIACVNITSTGYLDLTGDIKVKDDKKIYLDTGTSKYIFYDTGTSAITIEGDVVINDVLDWSANPCKPKIYSAAAEPDIPNDTIAFWWDTNLTQMWLIIDMGGTQYKVQLT